MKLTEQEKQLILKERAKADLNTPKKQGFLKFDLYSFDNDRDCDLVFSRQSDMWLCNKETKDQWIQEFKSHFEIALKKGTKFVCYINEDGEESWFDDEGFGVEGVDYEWAEKYLENIGKYKEE